MKQKLVNVIANTFLLNPSIQIDKAEFHFVLFFFLFAMTTKAVLKMDLTVLFEQDFVGVFNCSGEMQTCPLAQFVKSTHTTFRFRLRASVALAFFRRRTGIDGCIDAT